MPIYTVHLKGEPDPKKARLVRATTTAQALRHVAQDTLQVSVTGIDEAIELGAAGVKVEDASA